MGRDSGTRKKYEPQGPYSPPKPYEVDRTEGEPMAVANDKDTKQGRAFHPTTAHADQLSRETARKWRDPNLGPAHEGDLPGAGPETIAQQKRPTGHKDSDQSGYKELDEDA